MNFNDLSKILENSKFIIVPRELYDKIIPIDEEQLKEVTEYYERK